MTAFTEGRRPGDFIISLAHGNRSKENVTLASGNVVVAGEVLGKLTSGGAYVPYDNGGSDGEQTAVAIALANYDATLGDKEIAVVARDAEVIQDALTWQTTADIAAGKVDLAAVGIICRPSI